MPAEARPHRCRSRVFYVLDVTVFLMFFGTMILMVLSEKSKEDGQQSFLMVYIYMQFMVLYLIFRTKYCTVDNVSLLYRIHIFNFLFSIFTLLSGYVEVIRAVIGQNELVKTCLTLFVFESVALVLAHIVLAVYICCPRVSLSEGMLGQSNPTSDFVQRYSARLRHRRQTFEQLEIDTVTPEEGDCSVCLEAFTPERQVKCLPECKHKFHEECLRAWYARGDTCPVCRSRFSKPLELTEEELNFAAEQAYYAAVLGLGNLDFDAEEVEEQGREEARQSARYAINS